MYTNIDIKLEGSLLTIGKHRYQVPYSLNQYILLSHLDGQGVVLTEADGRQVDAWLNQIEKALLNPEANGVSLKPLPEINILKLRAYCEAYIHKYILSSFSDDVEGIQLEGVLLNSVFIRDSLIKGFELVRRKKLEGQNIFFDKISKIAIRTEAGRQVKCFPNNAFYLRWIFRDDSKRGRWALEIEVDQAWYQVLSMEKPLSDHWDVMVRIDQNQGMVFRIIDRTSQTISFEKEWKEMIPWRLTKKTFESS